VDQSLKKRLAEMIDAIAAAADGGCSARLEISGRNDELDALAASVNLLLDKLAPASRDFLQVFDLAADGMVLIDENFDILRANDTFAKMVGLEKKHIEGSKCYDVFSSSECGTPECQLHRILAGEGKIETELQRTRPDGKKIPCIVTAVPHRGSDGKPIGIVEAYKDITERKRAEEVLRESEQRYRMIAENVRDIIWTTDMNLKTTYISPSVTGVRGFSVDEVMAQSQEEIMTPQSLEVAYSVFGEALAAAGSEQAGEPVNPTAELELTCKDGSTVWTEVKATILKDRDNRPIGLLGIAYDISERKRAEEVRERLLRNMEERVKELTCIYGVARSIRERETLEEIFHDVAALLPAGWQFREIARCRVCFEEAEYVSERFEPTEWSQTANIVVNGKQKGTVEIYYLEERPPAFEGPFHEEERDLLEGAARALSEAVERKQSETDLLAALHELERKNAELDEFTYVASHDLQEPLRKLISFGDLLRKDVGDELPERAARDLGFITDAARRMQTLVQDLLSLSRFGSSAMRLVLLPLDDCVDSALEALDERVMETGAEVVRDELPGISADRTLLTQLYQNLIGNALKFVGTERPRIHLTAELENGHHVLGVRDNGIGIKPEHAEQIFIPFKRLHGRAEYSGSGIGLAICRKVVERHGGRIWVESEPGKGAHFRFTLGGAPGRGSGR